MSFAARTLPGLLGILLFFAGWQAYCAFSGVSQLLLPSPVQVLRAFADVITEPPTWTHLSYTLGETIGGFSIALVLGVVLGWLIASSAFLERAVHPFVVASQIVPKVALVPPNISENSEARCWITPYTGITATPPALTGAGRCTATRATRSAAEIPPEACHSSRAMISSTFSGSIAQAWP